MKNHIQVVNTIDLVAHSRPFFRSLFYTLLGCSLAVSSVARAVTMPPGGGYQEQNLAEGEDALSSLTTGADNTTIGFDALYSKTIASENALASWIWRTTGRLIPRALSTRRRCCKTAWSLLQRDGGAMRWVVWRAPNCTTRRAGFGLSQAASMPHVRRTRQRCYKTARSLLQLELTHTAILRRRRNWDGVSAKSTVTDQRNYLLAACPDLNESALATEVWTILSLREAPVRPYQRDRLQLLD